MSSLTKFEELVVEWVVQMLRDDPDAWKVDSHHLTHNSGTRIWIANDWWGVDITDNKIKIKYKGSDSYHDKYERRKPGILERIGICPKRPEDWRSVVWTAYEQWLDRKDAEAIKEWLKTR